MTHTELLTAVLAEDERLAESEREAFTDMLYRLEEQQDGELTSKQFVWVDAVARRLKIEPKPRSAGPIPLGKSVPTPEVLRVLPKSPPKRRVG